MNSDQLQLLKQVLPDGYEVVNEHTDEDGTLHADLWDGDEWQHSLFLYDTAKEVINKIIGVERARCTAAGEAGIRFKLKELLGVREDINAAIDAHVKRTHHQR